MAMITYNPNYQSRHSLEQHARRSVRISEPVAETEVVEYFDVDTEMAWYRSDTPNNLRGGGKRVDLSAHNKVGRGPYKKGPTAPKAVIQIGLDGELITTHPSINAAAKAVEGDVSSIARCANGDKKYGQVAGFKWAYQTSSE